MKKTFVIVTENIESYWFDYMVDDYRKDICFLGNSYFNEEGNEDIKKLYKVIKDFGYTSDTMDVFNASGFEPKGNRTAIYWLIMDGIKEPRTSYLDIVASVYSLLTGKNYAVSEIRGCCQSDWQGVIYNKEVINLKTLKEIEATYFGEIYELGVILETEKTAETVNFSDVDFWDIIPSYKDTKKDICERLNLETETVTILKHERIQVFKDTFVQV